MLQHFIRFKFLYTTLLFIILCSASFNNLPYGDDNFFVFDSYLKNVENIFDFWNPYSNFFKSWPLTYSVLSLMLKAFDDNVVIFRVFNILLHSLNSYLFLRFLKLWRPQTKESEQYLIFTLFLIHPISFITFNWIFQLKSLLCMTFSLVTLINIEKIKFGKNTAIPAAFIAFFLAINAKIACVFLPFYLLTKRRDFLKLPIFILTLVMFFSTSFYYGLINIKGINSFFKEKINVEKSITEYAEPLRVVPSEANADPSFTPLPDRAPEVDLSNELKDSLLTFSTQVSELSGLKEKIILACFTFGRYINSTIGLNRYSLSYEQNPASLKPAVLFTFSTITFIFFFFFFKRSHIPILIPILIFYIPISGLFYVSYMKYSFIADHWFYLSLPFMLSFFIINRSPIIKYSLATVLLFQFIGVNFMFTSTPKAIKQSFNRYRNPLLYAYLLEVEQKRGNYIEARNLATELESVRGHRDKVTTRLRLKNTLESESKQYLNEDLKEYFTLAIIKNDPLITTVFNEFSSSLTNTEELLLKTVHRMARQQPDKELFETTQKLFSEK